MEEQLISFETAKLAKEKGFGRKMNCNMGYTKKGTITAMPSFYEAPTQSLLQKWLREKHKIIVQVQLMLGSHLKLRVKGKEIAWLSQVNSFDRSGRLKYPIIPSSPLYSYEDALEEGLKIALNLIKNVKN